MTQSLVYKCELATSGMQDGVVPYAMVPPRERQPLLLAYRVHWPQIHWQSEIRVKVPNPSRVGVCGPFLHQVRTAGQNTTIELSEFPSFRLGLSPNQTKRCKWETTTPVDHLTLDESMMLLVLGRVFMYVAILSPTLLAYNMFSSGTTTRLMSSFYSRICASLLITEMLEPPVMQLPSVHQFGECPSSSAVRRSLCPWTTLKDVSVTSSITGKLRKSRQVVVTLWRAFG